MSATIISITTEAKAILKLAQEADIANMEIQTHEAQIRELEAEIDRQKAKRTALHQAMRDIYNLGR